MRSHRAKYFTAAHSERSLDAPETIVQRPTGQRDREADARTRTGDPFITSEVLYQLSYVGETEGV